MGPGSEAGSAHGGRGRSAPRHAPRKGTDSSSYVPACVAFFGFHDADLHERTQRLTSAAILRLAFQSLGVVFGDLGTSPLYVFCNAFPRGVDDPEDVVGALSLIIYSLTLVVLLKYVLVVLRANDNGRGRLMICVSKFLFFLLVELFAQFFNFK